MELSSKWVYLLTLDHKGIRRSVSLDQSQLLRLFVPWGEMDSVEHFGDQAGSVWCPKETSLENILWCEEWMSIEWKFWCVGFSLDYNTTISRQVACRNSLVVPAKDSQTSASSDPAYASSWVFFFPHSFFLWRNPWPRNLNPSTDVSCFPYHYRLSNTH